MDRQTKAKRAQVTSEVQWASNAMQSTVQLIVHIVHIVDGVRGS